MRSLDDFQRSHLLKTSVGLCVIALLLTPLAARSSMSLREHAAAFSDSSPNGASSQKHAEETVAIDRDPFEAPDNDSGIPTTSANGPNVVGKVVRQGDPIGYVVPARSNDVSTVVRAIISGSNPSALVEEGGNPRVVQAGDALGGVVILQIDAQGVLLRNGRRLELAESDR